MKKRIILIGLLVVLVSTGIAFADSGLPQVEETQGFATSTLMQLFEPQRRQTTLQRQSMTGTRRIGTRLPRWEGIQSFIRVPIRSTASPTRDSSRLPRP